MDILAKDLHSIAPVPSDLTLHIGMPAHYSENLYVQTFVLGCCEHSPTIQVFIASRLIDPIEVLSVLIHELIHASLGYGHGHLEKFKKPAREIGLTDSLENIRPDLVIRLTEISNTLGTYPKN